MKKILLPALLIGLLTACSDDDSKKSLNGKWQPLKLEMYSGNELLASEVIEQENNSCPDFIEFKSDGKYQSIDMNENCETEEASVGAYTFDGSNLKVTEDGESHTIKVTKLTETEFIMEGTETDGGVTYNSKIYLKKLK